MDLRSRLSKRIGIYDIQEINCFIQSNDKLKQELYNLLFNPVDVVSYQAAWVIMHFNLQDNRWLFDKQDELINELMMCTHPGKRRLLLNLLYRQPLADPPRTDFLDFCLDKMFSKDELPGVKTLCMKIAYELCRPIPELLQEFRLSLDLMEPGLLPISIRTVRKNIQKAMRSGKTLQRY